MTRKIKQSVHLVSAGRDLAKTKVAHPQLQSVNIRNLELDFNLVRR